MDIQKFRAMYNNYANQNNLKLNSHQSRDLDEIFAKESENIEENCANSVIRSYFKGFKSEEEEFPHHLKGHIEFNPFVDPDDDNEDYSGSAFSMI